MMETNVKDYLHAVCQSQTSPMEIFMKTKEDADYYNMIDVRMGPKEFRDIKILGAKEIPLDVLSTELANLPMDKKIAVYTWGVECTLAKHALLILSEAGYSAIEVGGGISAWKNANLPTEPVEN